MKQTVNQRIEALRQVMRRQGMNALIIPSTDPHSGEYVPDHWKAREWISGFSGSAGTAVVTLQKAALWTDSRYFIQAAAQLQGSEFQLMKDRLPETPSIVEWLGEVLQPGEVVGIDPWVTTMQEAEAMQAELADYQLSLKASFQSWDEVWTDRPAIPMNPVVLQPLEFAGESVSSKLTTLRQLMAEHHADGLFLSVLDEIAWTLNVRGNDVHCNPVALSYLLITPQEATFFVYPQKVTPEVEQALQAEGIRFRSYTEVAEVLRQYPGKHLWVDGAHSNYAIAQSLNPATQMFHAPSPVLRLKAIKNEAEIAGFRRAMVRDGIAMVKFLKWLEEAVPQGKETEMSIDRKLTALRAEQPLFKGISFDTIAGYQEHGAIVHYEATPETDKPLRPEGLLLLDSGAQYQDGTTDLTRTIALGPTTDEQKRDYTIVLKACIQLDLAKFPQGTCGTQLDILARGELWKEGLNYLHGTGHGVGSYLNVHEGPHQIRTNNMPALLEPGMTVTDEPGLYKEGRHGIRTENVELIVPYKQTEFGAFYQFEVLTWCPIDLRPLLPELLTEEERTWLNRYHRKVYETLAPHLDESHQAWLKENTRSI